MSARFFTLTLQLKRDASAYQCHAKGKSQKGTVVNMAAPETLHVRNIVLVGQDGARQDVVG